MDQTETESIERILFATIGNRDPRTDSGPTGPLRTAEKVQPTLVILIHTAGSNGKNGPLYFDIATTTRQAIVAAVPGVEVRLCQLRLKADDPTDLAQLLGQFQHIISGVAREFPDPVPEMHFCGSSGTPQMHMAQSLVGYSQFPNATFWHALDPEKTSHSEPLQKLELDLVRHHAEMEEAFRLLGACHVIQAADLLDRRLVQTSRVGSGGASKPAMETGLQVARTLRGIDEFQMVQALRFILGSVHSQKVITQVPSLGPFVEWYRGMRAPSGAGLSTNPAWPVELVTVALRAQSRQQASTALVRAAIANEVALAVALRTKVQINPDDVAPDRRDEIARVLLAENDDRPFVIENHECRVEGEKRRRRVLLALMPELKDAMEPSGWARGDRLARARNRIVHRGQIVDDGGIAASLDQTVDEGIAYLRDLFRALGWQDPISVPSAPAPLAILAKQLARWAGVSIDDRT